MGRLLLTENIVFTMPAVKEIKSISGSNQIRDLINHKVRFPLVTFPYFQNKGRIFIKMIQHTCLLILSFVTFTLVSFDFFLC